MKPIDLLVKAREIISKPENWVQGVTAMDKHYRCVTVESGLACAFCSVGALQKAYVDISGSSSITERIVDDNYRLAIKKLQKAMLPVIVAFNDSHSHEEVLAKWDEVIEAERKLNDTPYNG